MNPIAPQTVRTFPFLRAMAGALALAFVATALPADGLTIEDEEVFYQLGVTVGRSLTDFQTISSSASKSCHQKEPGTKRSSGQGRSLVSQFRHSVMRAT